MICLAITAGHFINMLLTDILDFYRQINEASSQSKESFIFGQL